MMRENTADFVQPKRVNVLTGPVPTSKKGNSLDTKQQAFAPPTLNASGGNFHIRSWRWLARIIVLCSLELLHVRHMDWFHILLQISVHLVILKVFDSLFLGFNTRGYTNIFLIVQLRSIVVLDRSDRSLVLFLFIIHILELHPLILIALRQGF